MIRVILITVLLVGCGSEVGNNRVYKENRLSCSSDTIQNRADFIINCISAANPKSDEEPEDWIYKCRHMAEKTFCTKQTLVVTEQCRLSLFGRCDLWREVYVKPVIVK